MQKYFKLAVSSMHFMFTIFRLSAIISLLKYAEMDMGI